MTRGRHRAGVRLRLVVLVVAAVSWAEARAAEGELLLVERPANLVVLNRYQQNITAAEKALFVPFVPMIVTKRHDVLGDGFTRCARVRLGGGEYFLVRDGSGRFAGEARAGGVTSYEGTVLAADTINVLRSDGLRFASADGRGVSAPSAGERLIRIFRRGDRTYVRRAVGGQAYGWADLESADEGRVWARAHGASRMFTTVPSKVTGAVRASLSRANQKLANLFAFFNGRATSRKPVPYWELSPAGSILRGALVNGSAERDFPESSRYLVRDIEHGIAGSGFRVFASADGFEVRPE
jgi:hypothetical protein